MTNQSSREEEIESLLAHAFAPAHKRAFGFASGTALAMLTFGATAIYLLRKPDPGFNLGLLSQFFYGYTVSWSGALVGAAWAFVAGFAAGWFFAFCRNLFLAVWIFLIRERQALSQTRDFLDHI